MADLFGAVPPPPAPARRRAAAAPAVERGAVISECGRYRYSLWRRWGTSGIVMFVGLNPSTADAKQDDPTIRRCMEFARSWGYGALVMCNLFAWRSTDPESMKAAADPVGPDNDATLLVEAATASVAVAAWGVHGAHQGRNNAVREMLPRLHCLTLTKDGHPGHPLYLPAALVPVEWPRAGAAQPGRPAEKLQVVQEQQPEPPPAPAAPPAPSPPRQYGQVQLHDGRHVDSGSEDWRRETLARYLLALPPGERNDWLAQLGQEVQADLRRIMRGLRATERGTK